MYQSHSFNYCQHCGVNTAAIEQAVLPHASSTFLTLRIKAPTLADSAALQTSSASQKKASALFNSLRGCWKKAALCQKYPQQPTRWLTVTHGHRTSKSPTGLCSVPIALKSPRHTPASTDSPPPRSTDQQGAAGFHNSPGSPSMSKDSGDVRREEALLRCLYHPLQGQGRS